MKTRIINLVLIISLCLFTNCDNDNDIEKVDKNETFNATVLKEGVCEVEDGLSGILPDYLIELNQDLIDLPEENKTIYYAANLPEKYKVEGLKINITFKDVDGDKYITCHVIDGIDDFPSYIDILTVN